MKHRKKIHEIDSTNDIRYRGPLTYQHFRIVGWLFIALSQLTMFISLADALSPEEADGENLWNLILSIVGNIATPLLLIANIAVILSARSGFKKPLIQFGALSAAAVAVFILIYERYAVGFFAVGSTREEAYQQIGQILSAKGFLAFNIFLDLFLLTLIMFFLEYRPKKLFRGKSLIVFRLFVLIPILYEALSITLKILSGLNIIMISPYLFPFLTTKPPAGFVVFVALALFIKRRERKFLKNGKTLEEYKAFLDTNANSWHFSVHAAIIMVAAVILDIIFIIIFGVAYIAPITDPALSDSATAEAISIMLKCGFGGSTSLLIIAPFMLLFSYNRVPKFPKLDLFIPIAGVVLIVIIYIEGLFWLICNKLA